MNKARKSRLISEKNIIIPQDKIVAFCQRWKIAELSFFGSVLREDFRPNSDIDVLVSFSEDAHWGLFDLVKMQNELSEILHRDVDLVEKKAILDSENYIRRKNILANTEAIYATR